MIDDKYEVKIELPDLAFTRARSFVRENLVFRPHVFAWNEFPSCEFERPLFVERMIGPYTIDVTYYDKDYNVVTEALEPGRYGAVARIKTEAGRTFTRFRTLFRNPERLRWWRHKLEGSIKLPEKLGIDPQVAIEQAKHVNEQVKRGFANETRRSDGPAKLLAGLYEMTPGKGEASVFEDPSARDRQWWVGLKRKLNGNDNRYSPFVCPASDRGAACPRLERRDSRRCRDEGVGSRTNRCALDQVGRGHGRGL